MATIQNAHTQLGLRNSQFDFRFGRKKAMMIGLFFELVFALAATFTPIYELYVALRFLVALCVAGSYTSMFVLCEYRWIRFVRLWYDVLQL